MIKGSKIITLDLQKYLLIALFTLNGLFTRNLTVTYDVALVFLSKNLDFTQDQIDKLLTLHIPSKNKENVRILGYPDGHPCMKESFGEEVRFEKTLTQRI